MNGRRWILGLATGGALLLGAASARAEEERDGRTAVLVVVGAPGTDEYRDEFQDWSQNWRVAADQAKADFTLIGLDENPLSDRALLQDALKRAEATSSAPLWLVLIGHGTYDGRAAKFNLRGPDVSAEELAEWMAPLARPLIVVNCASSSAPFINRLAGEGRIVITATKSGNEQNFTRFGRYFSLAIANPRADLDKDGQVSLLEAFLTACRDVQEFYDQDARLSTEHALLDDNGDGLGTPAAWFRGLRATQQAKDGATLDGPRAHQIHLIASDREQHMPPAIRERRNTLELAISELRSEKQTLGEDQYYARLQSLMVELATLYAALESEPDGDPADGDPEEEQAPASPPAVEAALPPAAKQEEPASGDSPASSGEPQR